VFLGRWIPTAGRLSATQLCAVIVGIGWHCEPEFWRGQLVVRALVALLVTLVLKWRAFY
jgi:hypothetical protein